MDEYTWKFCLIACIAEGCEEKDIWKTNWEEWICIHEPQTQNGLIACDHKLCSVIWRWGQGVRLKSCMRFSGDHDTYRDTLNENQIATLMHSEALNSVWRDKIGILMTGDFSTASWCQSKCRERQNRTIIKKFGRKLTPWERQVQLTLSVLICKSLPTVSLAGDRWNSQAQPGMIKSTHQIAQHWGKKEHYLPYTWEKNKALQCLHRSAVSERDGYSKAWLS